LVRGLPSKIGRFSASYFSAMNVIRFSDLCAAGKARNQRTDRKFNRMRPSMARVLGLETRSAKEG
jgi:hypothetical protein